MLVDSDIETDALPDYPDGNSNERTEGKDKFQTSGGRTGFHSNPNKPKHQPPNIIANGKVFTLYGCSNFQIGNTYNLKQHVHYSSSDNAPPKTTISLTQEIQDCFNSIAPISSDVILNIKDHIGSKWMDLGMRLGYSAGEIEQFHFNYKPVSEAIYNMLMGWKKMKTRKATIGVLCKCMWEVNEKVAAKHLSEIYKAK